MLVTALLLGLAVGPAANAAPLGGGSGGGRESVPPSESNRPGGGGESNPSTSECQSTPAACAGASTPLPGQAVAVNTGTTGVQAGCLTGRIVTTGTGQIQSDSLPYCPDTDGDGIADPPADGSGIPAPPPPPTHAEIVAQVCPAIPTSTIGVNPREWGVTGFATYLWDTTSPTSQSASSTIRGYPVDCTITPTTWTFDVNEPTAERYGHQRRYTTTNPGQESDTTDVQHQWSTLGTYPINLTVSWSRTSNYGQDGTTTSTILPYQVREVLIHPAPNPQ